MQGAETLRVAGIDRSVGFVVGLPGESNETLGMTMAVAAHVQPERVQFTRFTPLMGSSLADAVQPEARNGFHGAERSKPPGSGG